MSRRSGLTLVEVLVAIFVMGIGMLALLTLFPIGILSMARAIRDSRTSTSAYNAAKIANFQDIRNDLDVITDGVTPDFFLNPLPGTLTDADAYAESYPIFVDPIGYYAVPTGDWVGGPANAGVLRRRPVEFARRTAANVAARNLNILQSFTLWDDMVWESTLAGPAPPGTPQTAGLNVLRDARFSWAYVLRRPQTADRSIVDCTVVVFDQRTLSLTANQSLAEIVYPNAAYFNRANNTITVDYTLSIAPPIRAGQWIMDATTYVTSPPGALVTKKSTSANFYRVVASEDIVVAGKNYVRFEVQNAFRGAVDPVLGPLGKYAQVSDPLGSGVNVANGTVIVMEGIADVFEKGPARLP